MNASEAPLSFSQQRLWFLQKMQPYDTSYNIIEAIHIRGPLLPGVLEASVALLVHRHQILRTRYIEDAESSVVQQICTVKWPSSLSIFLPQSNSTEAHRYQFEWESIYSRECCQENIYQSTIDAAQRLASQPVDLSKDPVVKFLLLSLDGVEHSLIFRTHHIAGDGWSTGVMLDELASNYNATKQSPTKILPLALQYTDFSLWQREMVAENLEHQLKFWKAVLQDPPVLQLPFSTGRTIMQGHEGAELLGEIPVSLVTVLKQIGRTQNATLFMSLLSVFVTLLYRYTFGFCSSFCC